MQKIGVTLNYSVTVWSSTGLDCEGGEYADPPLLKDMTDEEVNHLAENPLPAKYELPPVPCHSQAVERHVPRDEVGVASI